jgi:hypothetical protein
LQQDQTAYRVDAGLVNINAERMFERAVEQTAAR